MKYENLRKGMVFEFIENRRNTEKASDDPTKFWEVIKLNQEQEILNLNHTFLLII